MNHAALAQWLIETAWQSAVLVLVIYAVQLLLRRWLSPAWRCVLWGLVAIRLVLPALPSSGMSVYGILASAAAEETIAPAVQAAPRRQISVHVEPPPTTLRPTLAIAAALPAVPEAPTFSWQQLLIPGYLLIAALLLLRRGLQILALRRLRRSATPCPLSCRIPVLESGSVHTPALAGILHPCILLPRGTTAQLSPVQLGLILDHELTHLRRRDHWAHAAWSLLQAVHWFNPFVYFAFSRYRLECELACDQAVLQSQREPSRRALYGQMLLDLATGAAAPTLPAVAMAEGKRHLKTRIRQIAAGRPSRSSALAGAGALVLLALCGLTAAQTPPAQTPPVQIPSVAAPPATRPTTTPAAADPLERRLQVIRFDGTRLEEVVEYLRDTTEMNILLDWTRLKEVGITKDSEVQMRLRNVSVRKCLDELCRQLPAADPLNRGAWVFDQGVVTISTVLDLHSATITKVYDVTDIAAMRGDAAELTPAQRLRELSDLITGTVAVNTWEPAGGFGTIRVWEKDNCLIISQTPEIHTQVDALLGQLRERTALAIDIQVRMIELPLAQLPAAMRESMKQDKPLGWYPGDELVAELIGRAKANHADAVMSAPRMTVMNGGTGRVDVWTDTNYLGSVKATTRPGAGAAPVYEPEIGVARIGLGVTVSPFISHDRKSVRLLIKHEAKRVLRMGEVSFKPVADAKESFTIQQPVTDQASVEANVSVETGKTVCLGERLLASVEPQKDGKEPEGGRVLLLLVTPNVIDLSKLPKPRPANP